MRVVLGTVLLLWPSGFDDGVRHFEAGRFPEAYAAFAAATAEAGDDASEALLYNHALAALRAAEWLEAEIAIEKATVRGGERFESTRDFVSANIAFAQCERAEILAARPEAGPIALDAAIAHADRARRLWQQAAVTRDDWPEARRNVERALRKLDVLRKKKADAIERGKKAGPKKPKPRPNQEEKPRQRPGERARTERRRLQAQLGELSPGQVRRLLEKLRQKENEKDKMRRARRRANRKALERDW